MTKVILSTLPLRPIPYHGGPHTKTENSTSSSYELVHSYGLVPDYLSVVWVLEKHLQINVQNQQLIDILTIHVPSLRGLCGQNSSWRRAFERLSIQPVGRKGIISSFSVILLKGLDYKISKVSPVRAYQNLGWLSLLCLFTKRENQINSFDCDLLTR